MVKSRVRFSFGLLVIFMTMALVLAACSGSDNGAREGTDANSSNPSEEGRNNTENTSSEVTDGGRITISLNAPPGGVFNPLYLSETNERHVVEFVFESLVELDSELAWKPLLAKDWDYENDNQTLVFYLNENVTWHDGEPFTAEDVKFTYEVIAHPDYAGVRREYVRDLAGYEEFSSGTADELSGVEVVDPHTVKFHFKEQNVLALFRASFDIVPKHIFSKYEVKDLPTAPEIITYDEIVGTGPFKASGSLTNESYSLERYENYWQGKPHLDGIVWRVVNPDLATGLLANGEIDILMGVSAQDYTMVSEIDEVELFEAPAIGYQWLGFKLNRRPQADVEAGVTNTDNFIPHEHLQDIHLRHAIAHAINREGIVQGLLEGHGTVLNGHIPPSSWAYNEEGLNTYQFDPQKAMEILDNAGYIDIDGDGFREDPNGNPLVLSLDYASGNVIRERATPIIAQGLEEIGLKINLRMPTDLGSLIGALENDEEMDLFIAGWSPNTEDPSPKIYWDTDSLWNVTRWNDPHQQELLDLAIKTPEAFDQLHREVVYNEWNMHINEQLPMLPLATINNIWAWNQKIKNIQPEQLQITRDVHTWYLDH